MCSAPLSMADIFLLASIGILAVVLLIEACAFLFRHQSTMTKLTLIVWTLPDKLHQRLYRN